MDHARIALVTGGNQGIGFEICRQLGERGITIIVGARNGGKGGQAADKLAAEGIEAHAVELDVTVQETVDLARERIASKFGRLDILVNNAGIFLPEGLPSETDVEAIKAAYEVEGARGPGVLARNREGV
ncbi:SDR family NAD(P)-dependent oxidoreductase [Cohnella cellulosilytica]|uniref:SDR family NAD(P)-dependent oxidoreductase n=1 Tax=Cohnella cellulosilytica TaxID=986710 RepID=A0ABW2FGH6_9BACL